MVVAAMAIAATSYALMSFGTAEMAKIEQEYPYVFYGVLDDPINQNYHWESTQPTELECEATGFGACEIRSSSPTTPTPNTMPPAGTYIVTSGSSNLYQ